MGGIGREEGRDVGWKERDGEVREREGIGKGELDK